MRSSRFVDTEADLHALIDRLRGVPALAVDTESNSFYVYYEKVCLIQLSTPDEDVAIDPLAVDVRPLGPVFADPKTELVIHASDYDIRCLKRDFGFTFGRLFDTMLAAKVLERKGLGLAALLQGELGVAHSKGMQRSDWGRRPLTAAQLSYAFDDTRHLLPLGTALKKALVEAGKLAEAERLFARQAACEPRPKRFDPNGWRAVKGVRALDVEGKAIARRLHLLREELAKRWDKPPFMVFGDETLLALAKERPVDVAALGKVRGLGARTTGKAGDAILAAIQGE